MKEGNSNYIDIFNSIQDIFEEALESNLIRLLSESLPNQEGIYPSSIPAIYNTFSKFKSSKIILKEYKEDIQAHFFENIFFCILAANKNFIRYDNTPSIKNGGSKFSGMLQKSALFSINTGSKFFFIVYKSNIWDGINRKSIKTIACIENPKFSLVGDIGLESICSLPKHRGKSWRVVAEEDSQYIFWVYDKIDNVYFSKEVIEYAFNSTISRGTSHRERMFSTIKRLSYLLNI